MGNEYVLLLMGCVLFLIETHRVSTQGTPHLKTHTRRRRYLLFPRDDVDKIQLIVGLGLPIPNLENNNINIGIVLKFNYGLPSNVTDFAPLGVDVQKSDQVMSRWHVYHLLEALGSSLGFDGPACVLRIVCESATESWQMNGILGDLMRVIFTPSTTDEEGDGDHYHAAERHGASVDQHCHDLYPGCNAGVMDLFNAIVHEGGQLVAKQPS